MPIVQRREKGWKERKGKAGWKRWERGSEN